MIGRVSSHIGSGAIFKRKKIIDTTPNLITSGLLIQLDAHETDSYPGIGTTVYDLINNYDHTLKNGATFTTLNGIKCFDCTTGIQRIEFDGTGPTLPTTGYTYITWAKLQPVNPLSFRTLLYTNSPKYTPITIPDGTNTLGYWDTEFRSSEYDLSSSVDTWIQYTVVGDNSSQKFYINDSEVGSTISFGSGGTTHWGWGNNNVQQPWGHVANLYFYNRKLSLSEIKQHYNFLSPRFVESTPTVTPTQSVTPTVTPTITETVTPTPTPTDIIPVTGYSFNLIDLPYNFPSSGNSIMNATTGQTGTTLINELSTTSRGFYFNKIDNEGIDRISHYSVFTGHSVTITLTQNNNTAIYSGDTNSFKFWSQDGVEGFVFGTNIGVPPTGTPSGVATLIQPAPTPWVIGQPVYVSVTINESEFTPTPTITPTLTITPTITETLTPTPTLTITPTVSSNLVLYFDPSNPSSYPGSGTTITDLSGNGLTGTLSNVTYTSPSFNFNGTNSTVSVLDNSILEPGNGDWTIEVWVNHTVIDGSSRVIFAKTDGGSAQDWGYGLRTSSIGSTFAEFGNGGVTSLQSNNSTLTTNVWYQVVAVWTNVASNSFELFINGVSQGSKSHSFTSVKNTTSPLYIGSFNNGQFSQWLNGKVGIVRIYNSALTPSQVTQNFNTDKSKYGL